MDTTATFLPGLWMVKSATFFQLLPLPVVTGSSVAQIVAVLAAPVGAT